MALLYNPRFVALDANGDPISGAQLFTYDSVSTSTPKATYSDAAQTVEHANPVVADANGVFPQIFGGEGEGYYLVLQDADDVTVDEFLAVQMIGQDATSVFLRDFALNGRLQAYGEAGVVNLEFMPPDGDDVGGAGRIGGAEDTQGEDLEIDFADTHITGNVDVDGDLVVGGGIDVGSLTDAVPVCTVRGTASAVASVDIALSGTYEEWELRLRNVVCSTSASISVRFSFDNGATFKSGAADYVYQTLTGSVSTAAAATSTGTSAFLLATGAATPTGGGGDWQIVITSKAARETRMTATQNYWGMAGTVTTGSVATVGATTNNKGYGKATHVQVLVSGGTATFDYAVIGMP